MIGRARRTLVPLRTVALLGLSLACSRQVSVTDEAADNESTTDTDSSTDSDTTETDDDTNDDTDTEPCATEWDCGLGERCEEGLCTCMGCGCWWAGHSPVPEIDGDATQEHSHFDIGGGPECFDDLDCEALEYCDEYNCIPTAACNEDAECRLEWDDRFCIDNLCRSLVCSADSECPDGSICESGYCYWLEVLPTCADSPAFVEVMLAPITTPDQASLLVLDVDGDTADDLLVRDGDAVLVHAGQPGMPGLAAAQPWPIQPGAEPRSLARGDIHGDGVDELLIGHASPKGIEIVVVGQASRTLAFVATSETPEQIVTVDADYDGWPDLITNTAVVGRGPFDEQFVEALLGDGQGSFLPTWTEDPSTFEFIGPFPLAWWEESNCERVVASFEPSLLGGRFVDGVELHPEILLLLDRAVVDASLIRATPTRSVAFVTTAELEARGLLARRHVDDADWKPELIEVEPSPGAVAFVRATVDDTRSYALIDHGSEPASFVEYLGQELAPSCRGSTGVVLDARDMQVGDFNADDREDLAILSSDGTLRAWLSSP